MALAKRDMYARDLREQVFIDSRQTYELQDGSLYPALDRLVRINWISDYIDETVEDTRTARRYHLEPEGLRHLRKDLGRLADLLQDADRRLLMHDHKLTDPVDWAGL